MPTSATSTTASGLIDHTIRQSDTLPLMVLSLTDDTGTPVVLTGKTVAFRMRNQLTRVPITLTGTTTVLSPTNGQVQVMFSAADTANYGTFEGEVVVTTTATSDVESFPNNKFLVISVIKGL